MGKDEAEAKNREKFLRMENALHDERDNGSWSKCEKKKKPKKSKVIEKKIVRKADNLIKVTTARQVIAEKVEYGRSKLVDKKAMRTHLVKSRMCRSIESGMKCPHGPRCRFAHSEEQLVIADCFFSEACNRVRLTGNGVYKNCAKNKCSHKHPGETKEQALRRLGHKPKQALRLGYKPKPKPLIVPNRGLKMMEKMGFKQGEGLGKDSDGRKEPVIPSMKKDRLGLGAKNPWGKKEKVKTETWTSGAVAFGVSIGLDVNAKPPLPQGPPPPVLERTPRKINPGRQSRKKVLCDSVGTGRSCRHGRKCRFRHVDARRLGGQLVFRVPQDMAVPTMQHAVARGLKNFKIEVE